MTATGVDSAYKTIYVTVAPEEWEAEKDPVRQYVRKALSTDALEIDKPRDDSNTVRLKHAIRKSASCDLTLLEMDGFVPWQSVVEEEQSEEILKQARKKKLEQFKKQESEQAKKLNLKARKNNDPTKHVKIEFYKILNIKDPEMGYPKKGFDPHTVSKMIDKMPVLAKNKYLFSAFNEPITALHMLFAIDAPLSCIKKCYKHNPDALNDTSSIIGSPIHYACWFNANDESVRYIASKDTDSLLHVNRTKRTPLHLACLRQCNSDLVLLLTAACPEAAALQDSQGSTPLHLAASTKSPDLEVIEDLTEVCPDAVVQQDNKSGSTPLHLVLQDKKCQVDIVKDLIASNHRCMKVEDKEGRTPLHVAVETGASLKIFKAMTKKHPKYLLVTNSNGETPYKLAKSLDLDKEILKVLKPHHDHY